MGYLIVVFFLSDVSQILRQTKSRVRTTMLHDARHRKKTAAEQLTKERGYSTLHSAKPHLAGTGKLIMRSREREGYVPTSQAHERVSRLTGKR
jgi:hypothetical protein